MNKYYGIGRATRKPEVRYTQGDNAMAIARFNLAIDRRVKSGEEKKADFIGLVAFGKTAEVIEKYVDKGTKIAVVCHVQTGSYKNKDGATVYTTDFIVDEFEFCESRKNDGGQKTDEDGFSNIPDGVDEDLPFGMPTR